jgi:hypothetical protein
MSRISVSPAKNNIKCFKYDTQPDAYVNTLKARRTALGIAGNILRSNKDIFPCDPSLFRIEGYSNTREGLDSTAGDLVVPRNKNMTSLTTFRVSFHSTIWATLCTDFVRHVVFL